MQQYKNILIGINTLFPDWLKSLKRINKNNIILIDFIDNKKTINTIIGKKIKYILPLSDTDYNIFINYYVYNLLYYLLVSNLIMIPI